MPAAISSAWSILHRFLLAMGPTWRRGGHSPSRGRYEPATSDAVGPATLEENSDMINWHSGKIPESLPQLTDNRANNRANSLLETTRHGIVAGAAGGVAEIAWVTLYAGVTGANPATLARGVTTAAGVSALFPADPVAFPVILGVTVHMALAVTLGIALSFGWRALSSRRLDIAGLFPFTLVALIGVWAVNFFVVLPAISPAFIPLVPYSVSLMSKILFGLAAAEALRRQHASARKSRLVPYRPVSVMIQGRSAAAHRCDRKVSAL
jgi:hypothetical protein